MSGAGSKLQIYTYSDFHLYHLVFLQGPKFSSTKAV